MWSHRETDRCIFNGLTIREDDQGDAGPLVAGGSCQIFDEKPSLDGNLVSVTHQDLQHPVGISSN